MAGQLLVAQPSGCAARLTGGTAIQAEIVLAGGDVAHVEEDVALAGPGRAAALFVVTVAAVTLLLLPAWAGLGLGPLSSWQQVAAGLGGLVAVMGGVKFVAMAWGLVFGWTAGPRNYLAADSLD